MEVSPAAAAGGNGPNGFRQSRRRNQRLERCYAGRAGPRRSWLRCRRLLHRGQADLPARSRPIFPNTNAYVGFCASGTALGKKFDGDPRFWKIGDGRLYLNLNGDIQAESSKDIAGNIAKADSNWQPIRTVAADRL